MSDKTCIKARNVHLRSTSSTAEARLFPALFSTVQTYTPRSVTFALVNLSCSRSTAMLRLFKSSPTLDQRIVGFGVPRTEQVNVTSSPCFAVILKWNDNVLEFRGHRNFLNFIDFTVSIEKYSPLWCDYSSRKCLKFIHRDLYAFIQNFSSVPVFRDTIVYTRISTWDLWYC